MNNKDDSILISMMEDKLLQCQASNVLTHTSFLDAHQCTLAKSHFKYDKHMLYGGYEDAERKLLIFLPDYRDELYEDDKPLCILRVNKAAGSKELSHRDYLGSILSLGIDRSVIGDIIVRPGGADIIVLKSMADYLQQNYDKAGHTYLSCSIVNISELNLGDVKTEEKFETVASLRLDNLISAAFSLSRTKAQEAIKHGLVFVNSFEETKPDKEIAEGDKLVLRGKGKAVLKEIGRTTRKDRIAIIILRYL